MLPQMEGRTENDPENIRPRSEARSTTSSTKLDHGESGEFSGKKTVLGSLLEWVGSRGGEKKGGKKAMKKSSSADRNAANEFAMETNDRPKGRRPRKKNGKRGQQGGGTEEARDTATPDWEMSSTDRYRLLYLIILVEQRLVYIKGLIDTSEDDPSLDSALEYLQNVEKDLTGVQKNLVGLRDNKKDMVRMVGWGKELDSFFDNIETICEELDALVAADNPADEHGVPDGGPGETALPLTYCLSWEKSQKLSTARSPDVRQTTKSGSCADVSGGRMSTPHPFQVGKSRMTPIQIPTVKMIAPSSSQTNRKETFNLKSKSSADETRALRIPCGEKDYHRAPQNPDLKGMVESDMKLSSLRNEIEALIHEVGLSGGDAKKRNVKKKKKKDKLESSRVPSKTERETTHNADIPKANTACTRKSQNPKPNLKTDDTFIEEFDRLLESADDV